jgi:IS30 family transposase
MSERINIAFTLAERKKIERFLKMRFSCGAIAKELGRSKNGVVSEVRRNGGKKEYNAEKAQEQAETRRTNKYKNLIEINKGKRENHPIHRMKMRIDNLEMQLEILYETIKEMKNVKVDK